VFEGSAVLPIVHPLGGVGQPQCVLLRLVCFELVSGFNAPGPSWRPEGPVRADVGPRTVSTMVGYYGQVLDCGRPADAIGRAPLPQLSARRPARARRRTTSRSTLGIGNKGRANRQHWRRKTKATTKSAAAKQRRTGKHRRRKLRLCRSAQNPGRRKTLGFGKHRKTTTSAPGNRRWSATRVLGNSNNNLTSRPGNFGIGNSGGRKPRVSGNLGIGNAGGGNNTRQQTNNGRWQPPARQQSGFGNHGNNNVGIGLTVNNQMGINPCRAAEPSGSGKHRPRKFRYQQHRFSSTPAVTTSASSPTRASNDPGL